MQVGSTLEVLYPFTAEGEGELTVPQGAILKLLELENPENPGWLLCKAEDGRAGYVPVDFLTPKNIPATDDFRQRATGRMSVVVPPAMAAAQQITSPVPVISQDYYQQTTSSNTWGGGAPVSSPAWSQRDALYGHQIRTPIPPMRRWYYRDIFNDMQGPFINEEMKQRVDARHIQPETVCVMEVGFGATQLYEERKLRELFPSNDIAFLQAPSLDSGRQFWFYLDDANVEIGPFSTDQMRFWFDVEGYFGSKTPVREAFSGSSFQPLSAFYPDPTMCFVSLGGGEHKSNRNNNRPTTPPIDMSFLNPFGTPKQSSRSLLKAALSGGTGAPPPLAIGKPGGSSLLEKEDDEDDTLALFDKIDLADEDDKKKQSQAVKPEKAPLKIYGDAASWPAWKGVPNLISTSKTDTFPTILYHFFTRPLNPYAGKILCHITREIDGMTHMNYNKFVLYLENETGPQPTAIAIRSSGISSTTFDIKLITNGRVDDSKGFLTIAKMECNFLGTQFLVHNAVPGHQGKAKDLCCILYDANRMSKGGPRKMKVGIPDVEPTKCEYKQFLHGATGSQSMLTSLQSIDASNLIPMLNKPPKWNAQRQAYSLDFGGRVTRASVKNFQLVDAVHDVEHENVILQHGRVAQEKFTMDVQHPMSLLQAFAVCLSSLHQKKAVD